MLSTGGANILPEEVTKFIGKDGEVTVLDVEKGAIRKFADAVDDQNPLYRDEEYARNSRYGAMIAPPGFFGWPAKWTKGGPLFSEVTTELMAALAKVGYSRLFDAGIEYEFFSPVRAGDTLTAISIIKEIREREVRTGKMAFVFTETTYSNQDGDLVAKAQQTFVYS